MGTVSHVFFSLRYAAFDFTFYMELYYGLGGSLAKSSIKSKFTFCLVHSQNFELLAFSFI